MKLKSLLRDAGLDLLRNIADFWELRPEEPEVWDDHEALSAFLYPRLQTPNHFKHTFDRLEVGEREYVYFLALHGGELPVDEFRRRTGLHGDEDFDRVALRLRERGFMWREAETDEELTFDLVGTPEPFVRLVDLPPYWRGFLGFYLQELGIQELKNIAKSALEYRFHGKKKHVLLHHVRNGLLDPVNLKNLLERQDSHESELFQQILKKNGACVWRDLLDGGAQKKFNHAKADLLDRMTQNSGLIYVWRAGANKYNNMVMTPRDLSHIIHNGFRSDQRTLEELSRSSERARAGRGGACAHPNVVLDNTQNILRDLAIFLAFVRRRRLKMLNNGGISRNDLKKVAPLLSHNKTQKYVAMLGLFAMSRKLMISVGEHWRVSKNAAAWLQDARRAYRELYEFWLHSNEWNEEYIDGDIVHVDLYPQSLINITELRKLILRVLEKTPTETWIDFETFAESLLPQVAIEIPGRFDHAPTEKSARHTLLVMESIIAESLYWLGLVTLGARELSIARELGNRPNESIAPFDVNHPLPAHLIGSGEYSFCFKPNAGARQMFEGRYMEPARLAHYAAGSGLPYSEESQWLTVQPNLEIVTPPDFNLGKFLYALAFTDVKKVDIMTTLTLSRESLRNGLEDGLKQAEIIDFLRETSRRELPETVLTLIEECGARHGEVDIGLAGGYITTTDPMHAEELRANPRIQRYVKDIFNERLILLNRAADIKKITRELEKMGFLPHVVSDTVHITGEGLFHVTLRSEELHELIATLRFAQTLETELDGSIYEDKANSLLERLSHDIEGELNMNTFVEPLVAMFKKNYEKLIHRQKDDEKKKLKKQVNRLLTRVPRAREPECYPGENPTSDPAGVVKMLKYAIEHETQIKIHYLRSTGEEIDEVIEPESLKGERLYALCQEDDEHHIYYVKRIARVAI